MELDFDKYCIVDGSPTTVLPSPRGNSKVSSRKSSGKPKCGNYNPSIDGNFAEINFNRYRSASCRDARSRRSTREGNERTKRGSVYQSSKEVLQLRRDDAVVGRKKIELSRGSASALSCGIIDSLCSSDEDSSVVERSRSSVMSLSEQSTSSFCKSQAGLRSRDSRLVWQNIASLDKREKQLTDRFSVQDVMRTPESAADLMHSNDILKARNPPTSLHKSLSAKLALPHSPAHSGSDGSKTSSPKVRFSPARKTFDPFAKSKSHKSPLSCVSESGLENPSGQSGVTCSEAIRKPPLSGCTSDKPPNAGCKTPLEKKENYNPFAPAYLHGLLKLEQKHGVPYFEFSVKLPDDVYAAKAWRPDNAQTWIYTFYSLHPKRKSNASGWGFKDNSRESPMVGQMKVSCYLYKELKDDRSFNDSMVTEFVLYDTTHFRTNSHSNSSSCSVDVSKVSPVSDEPTTRDSCDQNEASAKPTNRGQLEKKGSSASHFIAPAELHPKLEVAAMVVQIPFSKRVSLKFRGGEVDTCQLEKADREMLESTSPGKMHVVIPAGNHSLPSTDSCGPSPLLDRWRLGGGCGCGGWDMACPLHVFGNPNFRITEGLHLMDNRDTAELYVQGRKDTTPAFTMRLVEGGRYAVDFHAQLSSLQAFSICVAILHAAEASVAMENETNKQLLQSDSMRVFPDEEIKSSIDATGEEEKFVVVNKKMEEMLPYFVINPPFSPIARV